MNCSKSVLHALSVWGTVRCSNRAAVMVTAVHCCRIHRALPLLSLAALALLVLLSFLNGPTVRNPLDGCEFVYLDMGTNTGVQIRKLYESNQL